MPNTTNQLIIDQLESEALDGNITAIVILIHFATQINPDRLSEVLNRRRVLPGYPIHYLTGRKFPLTESFLPK